MFDIVIQLGAILAVVVFFFKKLWPFINHNSNLKFNKNILNIWYKAIVAVMPAIFFGALFAKVIKEKLFNPYVVAFSLIIGGIILILVENIFGKVSDNNEDSKSSKRKLITSIEDISFVTAFYIGLVQCLAMIPGLSRSGATIVGGMALKLSRKVAAEFSFYLAIPTMFAATVYSLFKFYKSSKDVATFSSQMSNVGTANNFTNEMLASNIHMQYAILGVGFITAFIVAYFVIKVFMNYISKNNFKPFAYYRITLGIIVLLYFFLHGQSRVAADTSIHQGEQMVTNQNHAITDSIAINGVVHLNEVESWHKLFDKHNKSQIGGEAKIEVEDEDAKFYFIHVYESFPDHNATFARYKVDKVTGQIFDITSE